MKVGENGERQIMGRKNGDMNKIYKVIWSEVRNCYVCVSELAKSHSKPKSRKALVQKGTAGAAAVLTAALLLTAAPAGTFAADEVHDVSINSTDSTTDTNYDNSGATGADSVAIGVNASAGATNDVVIGKGAGVGTAIQKYYKIDDQHWAKAPDEFLNTPGQLYTHVRTDGSVIVNTNSESETGDKANTTPGIAEIKDIDLNNSDAIAIGTNASAEGESGIAIGKNASTHVDAAYDDANNIQSDVHGRGIAIGDQATASGEYAIALGSRDEYTDTEYTEAKGFKSIAIGVNAKVEANSDNALAIGTGAYAKNAGAIAFGTEARATDVDNVAVGTKSVAQGHGAISVGRGAQAIAAGSVVIGVGAQADDGENDSVAIGTAAHAKGFKSVALGANAEASGFAATSIGENADVSGSHAVAFGYVETDMSTPQLKNMAGGTNSFAYGEHAQALGNDSTAFGKDTVVGESAKYGTAFGVNTSVTGARGTAFGLKTSASGQQATAFGNETTASHYGSTSFGNRTVSSGAYATSFGNYTVAAGAYSLAFGTDTSAGAILDENGAYTDITAGSEKMDAFGNKAYVDGDGKDYSVTYTIPGGETHKYLVLQGTDGKTYIRDYRGNIREVTIGEEGSVTVGNVNTEVTLEKAATTADGYTIQGNANATAFGNGTVASGENSTAFGENSKAAGKNSVALGADSDAEAENSFAALGGVVESAASNSAAIGNGARATLADTVALGSGSVADRPSGTAGYDPLTGKASTAASTDTDHAVWVATANGIAVGNGTTATRQITGVAAGTEDTDAVNVAQLKKLGETVTGAHTKVTVEGGTPAGSTEYAGGNLKLKVTSDSTTGADTYDLKLGDDIEVGTADSTDGDGNPLAGTDGKIGVNGKDGSAVVLNGKDGSIGLNGKDGANGLTLKGAAGEPGVDGADGTTTTRIVYETKDGETPVTHEVATLDDGLKFKGDSGTVISKKLNEQLNILGGATGTLTDNNIGVVNDNGSLRVKLAADLAGLHSVRIGGTKNDDGTWTDSIYIASQTVQSSNHTEETGNYVTGLENKTWNPEDKGFVSGRAATEDQLKVLQDTISNGTGDNATGGFGLKDDAGTELKQDLGTSIQVKGDANISTKVVTDESGNKALQVSLNKDVDLTKDGSVKIGDTGIKLDKDGLSLGDGTANQQIKNMASGASATDTDGNPVYGVDTNGANIGDVKNIAKNAAASAQARSGKNITVDPTTNKVNLNDNITLGSETDPARQVNIDGGNATVRAGSGDNGVTLDGTQGRITIGGENGVKLGKQTIANHDAGDPNAATGTYLTGLTNKEFHPDHFVSGRAATEDQLASLNAKMDGGLNFQGDDGQVVNKELGSTLAIKGGETDAAKLSDGKNIGVVKDGDDGLAIKLAKDITDVSSITFNSPTDSSKQVTIGGDKVDVGGNKVTNVADGTVAPDSKDAVNGSQLYRTNQAIARMDGSLNKLDSRLDRVGAGAAALAALHPLNFDPDDKLEFAAGYGNYRSADAVAVGAFYHPNEDTMLSVSGSTGGGENMVNAGLTVRFGQNNHVSRSRIAMGKEILDLRLQVEELKGVINHMAGANVTRVQTEKLFPDIAKNHWAYEAVKELSQQGLVEGYPDGTFGGDRLLTRYEFAMIVYRAIQGGADVAERLVTEFEPELSRIRVDALAHDKNGNPTMERVRVNKDYPEHRNVIAKEK